MSQFVQLIRDMGTPFNMIVMICLIFAFSSVIGVIVDQVRKYLCHRQDLDFKREMLDRGMSAEEIDRVIRADREQLKSGR